MGGGDITGDMTGIVGSGLTMAMGAVTIGSAGKIMMDASEKMIGKRKRKKKSKSLF